VQTHVLVLSQPSCPPTYGQLPNEWRIVPEGQLLGFDLSRVQLLGQQRISVLAPSRDGTENHMLHAQAFGRIVRLLKHDGK
jgi:hypothetical protein